MRISDRQIGPDRPPFIVAEIGANHGGDLDRALRMIDAAKASGADAVKFQAYEADTITLDCSGEDFKIKDGPWAGQRLYDLYRRCQTPFAWFPKLAARANAARIIWFASVFDTSSVDMLMRLDVPAFKIASFELVDLPLIRYAAAKGKPMILSTGMASYEEMADALIQIRDPHGRTAVLHCVSGYPTPPGEADLGRIAGLRRWWSDPIGISDHTTGIEIPIAATALGACIIEKHFSLDRKRTTADATFSLLPVEFKAMASSVRKTWAALQPAKAASEQSSRPLRRSLYVVKDTRAGEPFTPQNVRSIRPGFGLPPQRIDKVFGKTAAHDIARGTRLTWDMVGDG